MVIPSGERLSRKSSTARVFVDQKTVDPAVVLYVDGETGDPNPLRKSGHSVQEGLLQNWSEKLLSAKK